MYCIYIEYYELLGMYINILLNFICAIQNLHSFHCIFRNYCALNNQNIIKI